MPNYSAKKLLSKVVEFQEARHKLYVRIALNSESQVQRKAFLTLADEANRIKALTERIASAMGDMQVATGLDVRSESTAVLIKKNDRVAIDEALSECLRRQEKTELLFFDIAENVSHHRLQLLFRELGKLEHTHKNKLKNIKAIIWS